MRAIAAALLVAALPLSVSAQTLPEAQRFGQAPWWMDQPIIASTGYVEAQVQANRANFSAEFQSVGKTAPAATKDVYDKVRALGAALAAFGVDKIQVETTFAISPLYDQYRDKDGVLIDNERADRINGYEGRAIVTIDVRDVSVLEDVYATVLVAQPTYAERVEFRLEPDNETETELQGLAFADAAQRAKLAATATGARLGPVKLIDPTGRACEADVLVTGAPIPRGSTAISANDVSDVIVVGARARRPRTPPPAISGNPADIKLPLQPPFQTLEATACVVYSLAG